MKYKTAWTAVLVILLAAGVVHPAWANTNVNDVLAEVRAATAPYHDLAIAKAAGYNLVPGLDFCFDNPGVGGMGFHYINTSLMDLNVDASKPEALVFAPDQFGRLHFAAVEYLVPIAAWDAVNSKPPSLYGRTYERNEALGVYALHAWIWKVNPAGVFFDWNPNVSCSH